jgi:menaquinone-specific isochorismate synthase
MTIKTDEIIKDFSDFLKKHKNVIGKQEFSDYLISYEVPKKTFKINYKLSASLSNYSRVFHFENVEENSLLTGVGTALDLSDNGLGRFSNISKSVAELKNKIITNLPPEHDHVPLICGGMKFTVEHSDNEWKDFKDSDWFIPEFVFIEKPGNQRLFYNFLNGTSSAKKQIENFSNRLGLFLNSENKNEAKTLKVLSAKGLSPKDKKKWKILAVDAINKLSNNEISKIVLSRRVDLILSAEPNWDEVRSYYADNYSNCTIFFYRKNDSTFFGASPERLIKFENGKITIDILASSVPRGNNELEEKEYEKQMLMSTKLNYEHDLVFHQVKKAISKFVGKILIDKMPFKKLKNIQHLHTVLRTELLPDTGIFEILEAIYPTAAICGEPKEKALSMIKKLEDYRRGLYSGLIGFFNTANEGEFIIGIRSSLMHQNRLFVYAGNGIVAGSEAEKEFEETELKLKAILSFFDEKIKS